MAKKLLHCQKLTQYCFNKTKTKTNFITIAASTLSAADGQMLTYFCHNLSSKVTNWQSATIIQHTQINNTKVFKIIQTCCTFTAVSSAQWNVVDRHL